MDDQFLREVTFALVAVVGCGGNEIGWIGQALQRGACAGAGIYAAWVISGG